MICNACCKKVPEGSTVCPHCNADIINNASKATGSGMAKLVVICRKKLPIWMMVIQPLMFFKSYKVHISVDEKSYKLVSKDEKIEIPVVPGTHFVRISSVSKKGGKVMKGIGMAASFSGAVLGSGSAYVAGAAVEDLGDAVSDSGERVNFGEGEIITLKVKPNFMGQIVEDK